MKEDIRNYNALKCPFLKNNNLNTPKDEIKRESQPT